MRKLGIPPENLQPDRYSGPRANLVPCVEAKRRPLVLDRDYPLLTCWRVDFNPSSGAEGEVWQLVRFESNGNATWRRIDYTGAGAGLDTVTVDAITAPGINPVEPDGIGDMDILGNLVVNHNVPLETRSRALTSFTIEAQQAIAITGAPADNLDCGMCSFDDTAFSVDANGYVSLAGGLGPAIDSLDVDFATLPGVDPVVPSATGVVSIFGNVVVNGTNASAPVATHTRAVNQTHIDVQLSTAVTGAPGDTDDVGLCSFDDTAFVVDANGYVTLAGGVGPAIDSITVDAVTSPGVNPVVPSGSGLMTVSGNAVAAHSVPVETRSIAVNSYRIDAQASVAIAPASAPATLVDMGMVSADSSHFDVSANAYLQIKQPWASTPGAYGLGITLAAGVFTITKDDGTALSDANRGYVIIGSESQPGIMSTYAVTANSSFEDANGTSVIIGNLFGLTTAIATNTDIPFWIYAVQKDSEAGFTFMISRSPWAATSPSAANIGKPSSAVADINTAMWALDDSITVGDYDTNPAIPVGSFRMRMGVTTDDWTVQALSGADGMGYEYMNWDTIWSMPVSQFGAATGLLTRANGGTAPTWSEQVVHYTFDGWNQTCHVWYRFDGDGGTDGAGAVALQMILPFSASGFVGAPSSLYTGSWLGVGASLTVTTGIHDIPRNSPNNYTQFKTAGGVTVLNSGFTNGAREMRGTFVYRIGT